MNRLTEESDKHNGRTNLYVSIAEALESIDPTNIDPWDDEQWLVQCIERRIIKDFCDE